MHATLSRSVKLTRLGRRLVVCAILALLTRRARVAASAGPDAPVVRSPDARSMSAASAWFEGEGEKAENAVRGSACGVPLAHVASAFVIEAPDSNATTVIYLISKPVTCLDLSFSGWDRAITSGATVLELKVFGKTPGSFAVGVEPATSRRVAAVECTRTLVGQHTEGAQARGGWVALDTLSPSASATGRFALDFDGSQLSGKFDAEFCPGGHEP